MPVFSRVNTQILTPSFFSASTLSSVITGSIPTTNLALWLKADTGITLSGSDVVMWEDQSTTGYDVEQNINNIYRPTYSASNSALNNQSSIEISSGAGQFLTGSQFGVPSGHPLWSPDMTIFVMGELRSPWNNYSTLVSVTSTGAWSDGWAIGSRDTTGNLDFWFNGWNNRIYQPNVITGMITSRKILAVGRANSTANQLLYRLNGAQIGTTTYGSQSTNSTSYLTISGAPGGIYQAYASSIAEIIVYNSALTDSEITTVENYLTGKYGSVTPV